MAADDIKKLCRDATRILSVLAEGGRRKRTVLVGVGGEVAFEWLLAHGCIAAIGSKRGTTYGTPKQKKESR